MNAQINLTRYSVAPNAIPQSAQQAWPITIDAQGINIPSQIFVYRAAAKGDPFGGDAFSCVASVNQLFETPIDTAYVGPALQCPFYRKSTLELFCRSQDEADYIWQTVNEDVLALLNNYNLSYALAGTETVSLNANSILTASTPSVSVNTSPISRKRLVLDYQPAGTAVVNNNLQDMTNPNGSLSGWLPVSMAPYTWQKPLGAKWFYNLAQDAVLQTHWPLSMPFDSNLLYRNGILLPYNLVYTVTTDTIWWLDFDPNSVPGYSRSGGVQDGNAPWPADYVDRNNLGSVSTQLVLITP